MKIPIFNWTEVSFSACKTIKYQKRDGKNGKKGPSYLAAESINLHRGAKWALYILFTVHVSVKLIQL